MHTGFWWGDPRERDRLKDPDIDGRIILKWNIKTWNREDWTESIWLKIGPRALANGVMDFWFP